MMKKISLFNIPFSTALALLGLYAVPAAAASFDCTKAQNVAEKVICSDSSLSALDKELAAVYKRAKDVAQDPETLAVQQRNWLGDRNLCNKAACLYEAYNTRITRLTDYADALQNADADAAVFIPRTAADKTCPRIVMPDAPNVVPDCTVTDWLGLGQVGPHFRGYALYRISYSWNGQDLLQHVPALWTLDDNDPNVLRLDIMMLALPGLAGDIEDVAALRPIVDSGAVLSFSFPRLDGSRDQRRFDAQGSLITARK
ncbi:MAG: lysozyme inhibitor LprI family protein [Alphaproteobacteria bacterium]